jgi:hypothetical protein
MLKRQATSLDRRIFSSKTRQIALDQLQFNKFLIQ